MSDTTGAPAGAPCRCGHPASAHNDPAAGDLAMGSYCTHEPSTQAGSDCGCQAYEPKEGAP